MPPLDVRQFLPQREGPDQMRLQSCGDGDFEFFEIELAPESLRWIGMGANELGALDRHAPVEQRLDAVVSSGNEAKG